MRAGGFELFVLGIVDAPLTPPNKPPPPNARSSVPLAVAGSILILAPNGFAVLATVNPVSSPFSKPSPYILAKPIVFILLAAAGFASGICQRESLPGLSADVAKKRRFAAS